MPTKSCSGTPVTGSQIPAQTLFLGSSVVSFNASMAWSGESSQLTVSLIDDHYGSSNCMVNSTIAEQLPAQVRANPNLVAGANGDRFGLNHYHTCTGDNCYVNETGANFDSTSMEPSRRMVPGKVYYEFNNSTSPYFVSKYWYDPDPGFFGEPTRINTDNTYNNTSNIQNKGYDIIGTPVVFKAGNFRFAGLVKSWTKQYGSSFGYNLTIDSMQSLLSSCNLILNGYAGCVYSKPAGAESNFGGPRNYTGNAGVDYFGHIYQGNIPNVFNIYGFLESFGVDGFGGSLASNEGIPVNAILDALGVLTSCTNDSSNILRTRTNSGAGNFAPYGKRTAFSPFGRILAKCMQENDTYVQIGSAFKRFGVIPPESISIHDETPSAKQRCQFLLDLSDIPKLPNDFRLSSDNSRFTITDLLNFVAEKAGFDYYVDYIPTNLNNTLYNILKVKVISRRSQPRGYEIESTVNQLICNGYKVTSTSIGKEQNSTNARTMIVGGPIQRLYQAKSLRLAYSQSNHIFEFNSNTGFGQFINYTRFRKVDASTILPTLGGTDTFHHGKIKNPAIFSNHNPAVSRIVNSGLTGYYANNDTIQSTISSGTLFDTVDDDWCDNPQLTNASRPQRTGNYYKATVIKHNDTGTRERFFPLYKDVICPFFGFVQNETLDVRTGDDQTNIFNRVRPVWFDTWTGQILVVINVNELPQLSVPLNNTDSYFIISESEMRAAISGFDEFLVYSLAKTFKTDLIEMLRQAYITKSINGEFAGRTDAAQLAKEKHAWYWNLLNNIQYMGSWRLPWSEALGEVDGTHNIVMQAFLDLQKIYEFVKSIAGYYGTKYMVRIPSLSIYKTASYSHIALPTEAGTAFVFSGEGQLKYSYSPTNDGAWEEPGNVIDDCIPVGGNFYYSLINENNKIPPLLGYNASPTNAIYVTGVTQPSLDYSQLSTNQYIIVDVSGGSSSLPPIYNGYGVSTPPQFTPFNFNSQQTTCKDAFGTMVTSGVTKKLFLTTQLDQENIVFLDPENLQEPRVIVNSPGIPLYSTNTEYSKDPSRTILATVAMEDLAVYLYTTTAGQRHDPWIKMMCSYLYNINTIQQPSANNSAAYALLSPKMAHPHFAGIPLKSNMHRYGPWINFPYAEYLGNPSGVFPNGTKITTSGPVGNIACSSTIISMDTTKAKLAIDNWIVPTKVDFNDNYVPWNYGGNAFLDAVAISDARDQSNYQNVIENAQVDIIGLPIFSIGSSFDTTYIGSGYMANTTGITYTDKKRNIFNPLSDLPTAGRLVYVPTIPASQTHDMIYTIPILNGIPTNGPIITNIQCNAGPGGITSTYSFRTYTKKLGLFNKENSDKIKEINLSNIKRNKQLANLSQQSANNIVKEIATLKQTSVRAMSSKDFKSKLFGWSPSKVLIGQAYPYMNRIKQNPDIFGIAASGSGIRYGASGITGLGNVVSYSIASGTDLGDTDLSSTWVQNNEIHLFNNASRHRTDVGLFEEKEVNAQLSKDYDRQSVMSLDGIFSPVSFYPTSGNATYNFGYYYKGLCPFCNGTKQITVNYSTFKTPGSGTAYIFCKNCVRLDELLHIKLKSSTTSKASSLEILPPYIVTSGTDLNILPEFQSVQGISIPINLVSLQPIVVPYGEFKNSNVQNYSGVHPEGSSIHGNLTAGGQNRTYIDRCRHSIEVVGRGGLYPQKLNIAGSLNEVDHYNYDYYNLDPRLTAFKNNNRDYQNNQRFLGLRGPLVMHAWGYDLEGYPVPNAADEPYEIDNLGRYKRFKIKTTTKSMKYKQIKENEMYDYSSILYIKKEGMKKPENITDDSTVLLVTKTDDMEEAGGFEPDTHQGSIISKTQQFTNGKWTPKKKLKQFYLNWAERPDIWPVGPIDLRWDEDRKIWTTKTPSIYKMVYVTLEEDLVKGVDIDETYPARGFLDDLEYSKEPLLQGYRRLIYVRDKGGYTAPRGAKILCRYDSSYGFYEPISKQSYIVGGILNTDNTAVIQMSYVTGRKRGEAVPTMTVPFTNPFDFNIINGNKGLFTFMNGEWTLTAAKETS